MSLKRSYHLSHNLIPRTEYTKLLTCLPFKAKRINRFNVLTEVNAFFIIFALILVTCVESLQIPDQQTVVGKVFRYEIKLSSIHDLKYINVSKAGDQFNRLPEWLYFKRDTNELIGIPFEKGLFFIEVQIKYYGKQQWNDIFAIEVTDGPQLQGINQLTEYKCVLRIKQTFETIGEVWRVISSLWPKSLVDKSSETFSEWLQRFSISRITNGEYLVSYDIDKCEANHLYEEESTQIRANLKNLGFDSDVIRISRKQLMDENDFYSDAVGASNLRTGADNSRPNSHYRRNIADGINQTPVLAENWMTLTTSTIIASTEGSEPSEHDPISRVLIPSMISPTLAMSSTPSSVVPFGDPIENSILGHEHRHHHMRPDKYKTPLIYTTPVMAPERPTILEGEGDILTPIPITRTPSFQTPHITDTIVIAPSPSMYPEITTTQIETTTEEERPITSAEVPSTSSTVPNKTPYINKRIRKLELISGKYWKYTIPAETFVDFEDGDTRRLKLTFLMSTSGSTQEQPASDFWIQFDHENQYLYALPTDEDIGKHLFNLVAVDSSGAPVTETLEVHVRQHKNTRAFTHIFTLSDVYWDPFQFACLIEATSSLLKRVTTRVFFDDSLQTIAVQKIIKNEKENTWTISWTNDTLPTHPCPRDHILQLYSRLHDKNKVFEDSSAEPSRSLRQKIGPEFKVEHVHLNFIAKSACGSYDIPDFDEKKPKENPVFRNRIGKLGPFRLGQAFRYKIPEDTVFSPARQVGTRELSLTLRAIEPPEMPDFIYFDSEEQEIFGLTLSKEQINSYELNLIAEDTISEGAANDIFTIEIIDESSDPSKQSTFEVVINLLGPPGRDDLTVREKVDIIQRISSGMFSDGDSSSVQVLKIDRFQYDGLSPGSTDDNNYLDAEPENGSHDHKRNQRHKSPHDDTAPQSRHSRDTNPLHYFEIKWTNRTIVSQDNCPKDVIDENIYKRIFERDYDSLKVLKEVFEPNYDLINVEFVPTGVCKNQMSPKLMGPRPIPIASPSPPVVKSTSKPTPKEGEVIPNDMEESNEFLLTTIIPPVAILIALIFAAIVGCCFHRANKRRKSVEISGRLPGDSALNEREAFLQKGRIPIIFEFEQQQQQQNVSQQQPQQYNMTPVIMPPSQQTPQHHIPPQQQMTPLRQLSSGKSTYQALPQSGSQTRRQPPPYYK